MAAAHFAHGAREALREDGEFILYRSQYGGLGPKATVLQLAPVSARPSRESTRTLEHELSLKADLDPEWAAAPLALVEHEDRISNAVKFTGTRPHAEIEIGYSHSASEDVVVFVRDNGVGLYRSSSFPECSARNWRSKPSSSAPRTTC